MNRINWHDVENKGINGYSAVINMAGQNVLDPTRKWSPGFKQNVWNSRINTSSMLVREILKTDPKNRPEVCPWRLLVSSLSLITLICRFSLIWAVCLATSQTTKKSTPRRTRSRNLTTWASSASNGKRQRQSKNRVESEMLNWGRVWCWEEKVAWFNSFLCLFSWVSEVLLEVVRFELIGSEVVNW